MSRPTETDFPIYYASYISQVNASSLQEAVTIYSKKLLDFFLSIPEEKAEFRYATGKWTIKELLQHLVDTERIMCYRVLRISRKDKTPLSSFDENSFATHSLANQRSLVDIKAEFMAVRKSTDLFIASLTDEQLAESGTASNLPITANALGFIIFGHMLHHKQVLLEKYL